MEDNITQNKSKKITVYLISACVVVLLIILSLWAIKAVLHNNDKNLLKNIDTSEVVKISEQNLLKNFFKTEKTDPNHEWLSVGQGAYNKQFYARDTFVSFMGGVEANDEIRNKMAYAIDWFGSHMKDDGYVSLWFQETDQLNTYNFCPYNLTPETGGIKQLDHELEFIDAVYLYYNKTGDISWLRNHIQYLEKARNYLLGKTNDYLLVGDYSEKCGDDWADQIRKSGKSSFVNAYWYKINIEMAEMQKALGGQKESIQLLAYSKNINKEFNKIFWVESEPLGSHKGRTGHYIAWVNKGRVYDFFDLSGNTLAVAVGLAEGGRERQIMNYIKNNFDYFVNQYGATRVISGYYDSEATALGEGESQNGSYWYIPSYYLTMALAKNGDVKEIKELWEGVRKATEEYKDTGLTEWYKEDGAAGGAMNYSWSLSYPIFLSSIIKNQNAVYKIK